MQRQEQTNTFQDGIISDMHPLSATNTSMTDALNATIVTYNGNEMILQNDMGNAKLFEDEKQTKPVKLTDGFEPIGVKEHGGILYIASIDKNGNFELGSFPGPKFQDPNEFKSYALNPEELTKDKNNIPMFTTDYYDNVFPLLNDLSNVGTIIENSNLYKNISLVDSDKSECILKVGQEYLIRVGENNNLSTPDSKKLYKVKFINLENNKEITEEVKDSVSYTNNISLQEDDIDKSDYKYFPNIANTKLGVVFEFEDIDIFKLGQTYQLINDEEDTTIENKDILIDINKNPVLDIEYNGGRYPQFTTDFEVIFQTLEYKTTSQVKVTHFYIEWELISKIDRDFTDEEKKGLNGTFYGELSQNLYDKFNKTDKTDINNENIYKLSYKEKTGGLDFPNGDKNLCIIKLPKEDNKYILKYTIYPIWDNENNYIFNCYKDKQLNLHNDYKKTLYKWIISEEIDLELNPSLWGSKTKYVRSSEFEEQRYLCADHYYNNEDGETFVMPINNTGVFDFLQNCEKYSNFKINDSETVDTIKYVENLGEGFDVFPYKHGNHWYHLPQGLSGVNPQPLVPYQGYYEGSKLVITTRPFHVYHFIHKNPIGESINIKNKKYYNIVNAKLTLKSKFEIRACKNSPIYIYDRDIQDLYDYFPIMKKGESGLNPLCQEQILSFDTCPDHNPSIFNTWKTLSTPAGGSGDAYDIDQTYYAGKNLDRLYSSSKPSYFGFDGAYNNKFVADEWKEGLETYNSNTSEQEIRLDNKDYLDLNIYTHIFALFAKDNRQLDQLDQPFDPKNWSFFQNLKYFTNSELVKYKGYNFTASQLRSWGGDPNSGAIVLWKYNYDLTGTILKFDNDLNQKIILALKRSRQTDKGLQFFDNFNNSYTQIAQTEYYPKNTFNDKDTPYYKLSNFHKSKGFSMGFLAPHPICVDNSFYNYFNFQKADEQYTYSFENIKEKYVNIRFYLCASYISNGDFIITSEDIENLKIYIQTETSDITLLPDNKINKTVKSNLKHDVYFLVQVVGKLKSENVNLTVKSTANYPYWTIRNICAFGQDTQDPYLTYAITTYSASKGLIYGIPNKISEITHLGYLPKPNYYIDNNNPWFSVDDDGYTEMNGEKIKIIE